MDAQNRQFLEGIIRGAPVDTAVEQVLPIYSALQAAASYFTHEIGE